MKGKINYAYIFAGIGIFLIILAIAITTIMYFDRSPLVIKNNSHYDTINNWAGSISTPILNIAGFLMIFAAFLKQAQDTNEAREESDIQRFESSLFNLLNLQHQIAFRIQDSFKKRGRPETNFFSHSRETLKASMDRDYDKQVVTFDYDTYYQAHSHHIDHYIQHVLLLVDYIFRSTTSKKRQPLAIERQEKYMETLKGQLSTDELVLIFFHLFTHIERINTDILALLDRSSFFESIENLYVPSHVLQHLYQPQ